MYIDLGGGSGEAEYDIQGTEEFDIDTSLFGLGFQLETNPLSAKNFFSYRFQVGLESRGIEIEDDGNATLELGGLVINNTFAFGGNPSERSVFGEALRFSLESTVVKRTKSTLGMKFHFQVLHSVLE